MLLRKYQLYILSGVTLIGFPLLGYVVNYFFSDHSFWQQLNSEYSILTQLCAGFAFGLLSGIGCWLVIRSRWMLSAREKYIKRIRALNLNYQDIILVSICAGVGEEMLFRGVIQEFMGVWLTSVVFVGIHGYYDFRNWRIFLYGSLMTISIVGVGYLFVEMGILAPIIAHFVIDVILLSLICRSQNI